MKKTTTLADSINLSTLSQHTLNFLQGYCNVMNDCAKENPELFQDEPFKVLTVDTMTLSHIKSAIEIEEEGLSCGMKIDRLAINELLDVFVCK